MKPVPEIIASDVSTIMNQKNFGLDGESDPRFVANSAQITSDQSIFIKCIFTVCKKRDGENPPWTLQAKKITHDKVKKTIYYDSALLKVYGVPIFYFPRLSHPDPTVDRRSGFLSPSLYDTQNLGEGIAIPYFFDFCQKHRFLRT